MTVQFEDQPRRLRVAGRDRLVVVEGSLIKTMWSAFSGPQTAEGVVAANMDLWHSIIADKIRRAEVDPTSDEPIRLTSIDWEG